MPLSLLHVRWRVQDTAQIFRLTEALLRRKLSRVGVAAEIAPLTRNDRYLLLVAAARGVCEVGATSDASYTETMDALRRLGAKLRGSGAMQARGAARGGSGRAAGRVTAARAPADAGDAHGKLCSGCWKAGLRKDNAVCERCGKDPLRAEDGHARPQRPYNAGADGLRFFRLR